MKRTPLTDDQMWALVTRDKDTSLAAMARHFGCPESTVRMAHKRLQEHGWVCTVSYGQCGVCGETVTRQGFRAGRRAYHPDCRPQAVKALNADYYARRWASLSEEQKRTILQRGQLYTLSRQQESLQHANQRGMRWQPHEDAFILQHPELTEVEIARELGRTLYAVTDRKKKLRQRGLTPVQ